MTIEIRELVTRAVVDARGSGPPPTDQPPRTPPAATTAAANPAPVRAPEDREALVARCVREVLREPNGARAIQLVFRYLCEVRGEQEVPILRQIAIRAANEANMRTIADMFRDEGIDEGERTLLRRQLRTRFGELPEPLAVRLDNADRSTLERIADRILSASSLDEVFAG